ncbi:hypothetical protein G5I_12547 [Acromyrmex echinatior]|uniref:Uncharacterized protein n=1 Tax=Acromyrmex echinatior TaxID=103372 RepID=F4X2L7_ACREC|nr:hypothetical protein G5I_12547 [Acromyrmex echinatior]
MIKESLEFGNELKTEQTIDSESGATRVCVVYNSMEQTAKRVVLMNEIGCGSLDHVTHAQ